MKTFRFQGYSDDTFGEYEQTNDDYDNCGSGTPINFVLQDSSGAGVVVTGCYCNESINKGDGWMIGVAALDEDHSVKDWSFELNPSHEGYRNSLTVIAPDSTKLTCLNRDFLNQ